MNMLFSKENTNNLYIFNGIWQSVSHSAVWMYVGYIKCTNYKNIVLIVSFLFFLL